MHPSWDDFRRLQNYPEQIGRWLTEQITRMVCQDRETEADESALSICT
jgi:hypothetical protein